MNAQQLLDFIIVPTLKYMGGNYNSKNAQMLLLATAAIESECGYYIKQIGGPALGVWQMEPATHSDIWAECDALYGNLGPRAKNLGLEKNEYGADADLIDSPMYSCAMARLKYSMDSAPLPSFDDERAIYDYYKRIYNTHLGASTWEKFHAAWLHCGLDNVELSND